MKEAWVSCDPNADGALGGQAESTRVEITSNPLSSCSLDLHHETAFSALERDTARSSGSKNPVVAHLVARIIDQRKIP
jgi:hypothetical protein